MKIIAKNIAPDASIVASPSMQFPESNLLLPTERGRVAQSTGLASQQLTLSWSSNQKAGGIALIGHNLTTAGTVRSIFSDVTPATLYDSTALAAFSTTGLDTDIDDYTDIDFRGYKVFRHYFTQITTIRSLVQTWSDALNPDGCMNARKLIIGKVFEPEYPTGAIDMTPMDSSVAGRADDGTHQVDRGWQARVLTVSIEAIVEADRPTWLAFARSVGKFGECFVDLYPSDTGALGIYGRGAFRLVDSPTFNHFQYGIHKNTLRFEET